MSLSATTDPSELGRRLRVAADGRRGEIVDLARRLIKTPSLSGQESAVASVLKGAFESLAYDDVWVDQAGNVIGVVRGTGQGRSVQFNTHLDHVDPGEHVLWSRPPYGAVVEEGTLYGRAASDVKGAMAAQAYLWAALRDAGIRPAGDVFVVGVVLEEVGGFGTAHLCTHLTTDVAVVGEASNNELRRGHRGRIPLRVAFSGLSAHASVPSRARNPHFACARFLLALEQLEHPSDTTFGGSSTAPTTIKTDQLSANVTPGQVVVTVDWRSLPSERPEDAVGTIRALADEAALEVEGVSASVVVIERQVRTYTGIDATMPPTRGFETPGDDASLAAAQRALSATFGRPVPVGTWGFSTDGGHLAHAGIRTIGFAPSEERFAHTVHDQVSIDQLVEAVAGNAALALALTEESS